MTQQDHNEFENEEQDNPAEEQAFEAGATEESEADAQESAPVEPQAEDDGQNESGEPDPFEVLKKLQDENNMLKDKYVRAHAEMENIRRRAQLDVQKSARTAIRSFSKDILSVADNMTRALASVPEDALDNEVIKNLSEGVQMTERELLNVFERHGIKKMDVEAGNVFDPNFHQVVSEIPDPSQLNGAIVQVLQEGYLIGEQILREAMVVVAKGGPKAKDLDNPPGLQIDTSA